MAGNRLVHNATRRTMGPMELGVPAVLHGTTARRVGPIAGAGALAVGVVYLAGHDPSAAGSTFPACPFHQVTGLWCPGCGLTRGCYELVHGHLGAAIGYNVFTPLAVVAIVVGWLAWLRVSWGRAPIRAPRVERWLLPALAVSLLTYGVVRNIPIAPLRSLAP